MAKKKKDRKEALKSLAQKATGKAGRAEYLKYGDVSAVSDVDVRTTMGSPPREQVAANMTATQWAQKLASVGGGSTPIGTKFRHDGKTYKIATTGQPAMTIARLVTT